jgi:S1-C subfamily serine protease
VRRGFAIAGLAAIAIAVAGCGGGGHDGTASGSSAAATVERTKVEVVKAAGDPRSGFDPHTIYDRDAPGVVTVLSIYQGGGLFGGSTEGAEGSGFVLNGNGEIATNAHVVTQGSGTSIHPVSKVYVRFQDDNQVSADIVGFDPYADVALLRVDPHGLTLRPLDLGTTKGLPVGEPVAAIGSPFGEEQSLSVGVVSATDRTIDSLTKFSISGAIQTDAAINHGNSGGPLVDSQGRVLGINSQISSDNGDGTGVGFAVPIDTIKRSLDQLRSKGHVDYAYLGVSTAPLYPQLAERLKLPVSHGALVADVVPGGPADKAGLKAGSSRFRFQSQEVPRDADVITSVAGHPIRRADDLGAVIQNYAPDQTVAITIVHGGKTKTIRVKLGKRAAAGGP